MKLYSTNKSVSIKNIFMIVVFAAVIIFFIGFFITTEQQSLENKREVTLDMLKKACVSCYALEGSYPQNIEYLEENYGVVIDHKVFIVDYDVIGSNIPPYIDVVVKGNSEDNSL